LVAGKIVDLLEGPREGLAEHPDANDGLDSPPRGIQSFELEDERVTDAYNGIPGHKAKSSHRWQNPNRNSHRCGPDFSDHGCFSRSLSQHHSSGRDAHDVRVRGSDRVPRAKSRDGEVAVIGTGQTLEGCSGGVARR